ncbi:hypothetical protein ORI98_14865 [Shewanella sp. ULN5]|uniref:FimV/HubP family polar landmark protein n=1 Tax=Shewanella sp. ULN5 TaxID=2994678 RepID=UPI00273F840F|nr:FimV/HubP family polar landmark protein [Shewanella sp. ULN5]MDP5147720.1 hypothetical protein [Shewanella sp. ULN5]
MKKLGFMINSLILIMTFYCSMLSAEVSHVSINSRQFAINQAPSLKVNFISKHKDLNQFYFTIKQGSGQHAVELTLTASRINPYLIHLQGDGLIMDRQAKLIVSIFRNADWLQIASLPVFDAPLSNNAAELTSGVNLDNSLLKQKKTGMANSVKPSVAIEDSPLKKVMQLPTIVPDCLVNNSDNETLWKIANRYKLQWNTNVYGAMLAIFEVNTKAFSKQRIHLLLKDASLNCPAPHILAQYNDVSADRRTFEALQAKHLVF